MQFNYGERAYARRQVILLDEGPGTFNIREVEQYDKFNRPLITKKGDPKVRVKVEITDKAGISGIVYEHLTAKTGWRLGGMLKAIGKGSIYKAEGGSVDPRHLVGGSGACTIYNEDSEQYGIQNKVYKYLPTDKVVPITELPVDILALVDSDNGVGFGDDKPLTDGFEDEELPF